MDKTGNRSYFSLTSISSFAPIPATKTKVEKAAKISKILPGSLNEVVDSQETFSTQSLTDSSSRKTPRECIVDSVSQSRSLEIAHNSSLNPSTQQKISRFFQGFLPNLQKLFPSKVRIAASDPYLYEQMHATNIPNEEKLSDSISSHSTTGSTPSEEVFLKSFEGYEEKTSEEKVFFFKAFFYCTAISVHVSASSY